MSTLIYSMMVSLDGYIAAPDGSLGWADVDDELHSYVNQQDAQLAGYLMGRGVWQEMDGFWQTAGDDPAAPDYVREFAGIYRSKPKIVFSHTLDAGQMSPGSILADTSAGVEAAVRQTMDQHPGRWSVAGAELAAECLRLGLVDEVELYLHPVILGGGKPFFPRHERPQPMTFLGSHNFRSGVVHLRYDLSGRSAGG